MTSSCPFCSLPADRHLLANDRAVAIRDGYPVPPGHTLIIPHRHVGSFFEVTDDARAALMQLLLPEKADYWSEG